MVKVFLSEGMLETVSTILSGSPSLFGRLLFVRALSQKQIEGIAIGSLLENAGEQVPVKRGCFDERMFKFSRRKRRRK